MGVLGHPIGSKKKAMECRTKKHGRGSLNNQATGLFCGTKNMRSDPLSFLDCLCGLKILMKISPISIRGFR